MKTTLDIEEIVFQAIVASSLKSMISGAVYMQKRPLNSAKEDIVVVSLPTNNLQLQSAVVNVNIHVPNKVITTASGTDNTIPNHARLKVLSNAAVAFLADTWQSDYSFDVQQQTTFEDVGSHYSNIRLDFYSINVLN